MNLKLKSINLISSIFILLISFGFTSSQETEFSFEDEYGNTITIQNFDIISDKIDKQILIDNIKGSLFNSEIVESDVRFDIIISDFKKVNRNNYKFRIIQHPRTKDIRTQLKYMGGGKYYKLKMKITKRKTEFIGVEYLYSFT